MGCMASGEGAVKTAERVAALLELLGRHKTPMRLMEVAQALDIPKSSAHGLLHTLAAKGFVVRDELQRYRIGVKLFSLAAAALNLQDVRDIARPTMQALAEHEHVTCNLAILDGHDVLYIEKVEDHSNPVRLVTHVGTRLPAHITALGKVLVAEMPSATRKIWLTEHEFVKYTSHTRTDAATFARDLRAYERVGYAVDSHEFHDAINGYAAGVRDCTGSVIAALSVTCLGSQASPEEQASIGRKVSDAAEEISLNLAGCGVVGAE